MGRGKKRVDGRYDKRRDDASLRYRASGLAGVDLEEEVGRLVGR
jgi:hypothetical protein